MAARPRVRPSGGLPPGAGTVNLRRWLTVGIGVKRWLLVAFLGLLVLAIGVAHVVRQVMAQAEPGGPVMTVFDAADAPVPAVPAARVRRRRRRPLGRSCSAPTVSSARSWTRSRCGTANQPMVEVIYQKRFLARGPRVVAHRRRDGPVRAAAGPQGAHLEPDGGGDGRRRRRLVRRAAHRARDPGRRRHPQLHRRPRRRRAADGPAAPVPVPGADGAARPPQMWPSRWRGCPSWSAADPGCRGPQRGPGRPRRGQPAAGRARRPRARRLRGGRPRDEPRARGPRSRRTGDRHGPQSPRPAPRRDRGGGPEPDRTDGRGRPGLGHALPTCGQARTPCAPSRRPRSSSSAPAACTRASCPALLVPGIREAIAASGALVVFACNVATQQGETGGYDLADHVDALERHGAAGLPDIVLANNRFNAEPPAGWLGEPVRLRWPPACAASGGPRLVLDDLVDPMNAHRHDPGPSRRGDRRGLGPGGRPPPTTRRARRARLLTRTRWRRPTATLSRPSARSSPPSTRRGRVTGAPRQRASVGASMPGNPPSRAWSCAWAGMPARAGSGPAVVRPAGGGAGLGRRRRITAASPGCEAGSLPGAR